MTFTEPMKAIAILLIASFLIDRIVTGVLFLLSLNADLRTTVDPTAVEDSTAGREALRAYRLIYAILAGYLSIVVLAGILQIRLLEITGLGIDPTTKAPISPLLDTLLTGLVMVGGADRVSEFLTMLGGKSGEKDSRPIQIAGTLTLENSSGTKD